MARSDLQMLLPRPHAPWRFWTGEHSLLLRTKPIRLAKPSQSLVSAIAAYQSSVRRSCIARASRALGEGDAAGLELGGCLRGCGTGKNSVQSTGTGKHAGRLTRECE